MFFIDQTIKAQIDLYVFFNVDIITVTLFRPIIQLHNFYAEKLFTPFEKI